jgi:HlyD family secretion protein|tara:strand:+ start:1486 stop:2745 length:1260 start_codon:yes stop_codon:yes gene_type:complete
VKNLIEKIMQHKMKVLGLLIVVLGLSFFSGNGDDATLEVSVQKVQKKDLSSKVVADGVLTPETEVKLSANNTTYITEIAVKEGDFVKKGDFLMSLDDRQQKAATEASRASLEAAKVQLEQRKAQQERQAKLYAQGLISDQEMESTNSSYASALSAFNGAQSRLIQDEDALAKLRLIAPQDGTITFIDGEVGDLAQGGMFNPSVLLKLSDLSKMEVYVNVNENDIADISLNDSALIQVDAYQNRKFKGLVKEVAYAATTSSGGSSQQVTNFQVKVQMLEVVEGMRPGMSATVDIVTEERIGVIAIPIQALTTPRSPKKSENKSGFSAEVSVNGDSQWSNRNQYGDKKSKSTVVFILKNDNTVEERVVEAGIVGDRDYEIISGLDEGETIVTGSFIAISRELFDGAVVKVKENSRPNRKRG